jgi:hypothetical protein
VDFHQLRSLRPDLAGEGDDGAVVVDDVICHECSFLT